MAIPNVRGTTKPGIRMPEALMVKPLKPSPKKRRGNGGNVWRTTVMQQTTFINKKRDIVMKVANFNVICHFKKMDVIFIL